MKPAYSTYSDAIIEAYSDLTIIAYANAADDLAYGFADDATWHMLAVATNNWNPPAQIEEPGK